jgi:hypothetical protein
LPPPSRRFNPTGFFAYRSRYSRRRANWPSRAASARQKNPLRYADIRIGENWLFSWTELEARRVGIVQSLLVTCRLHEINPYDYFVDVLQRIGQHRVSHVHERTPRIWKQRFAQNPLRSDLHHPSSQNNYTAG